MVAAVSYILPYAQPVQKFVGPAASVWGQLIIEKSQLFWLDYARLAADFPQRVKILGDTVAFAGPVSIYSPPTPGQVFQERLTFAMIAGLSGLIWHKGVKEIHKRISKRIDAYLQTRFPHETFKIFAGRLITKANHWVFTIAISALFAAFIFFLFGFVGTGKPSIQFYQWPVTKII